MGKHSIQRLHNLCREYMKDEKIIQTFLLKGSMKEIKIWYNGEDWMSEKIRHDFLSHEWKIDPKDGENLIRQSKQHLIHDLEKINFKPREI